MKEAYYCKRPTELDSKYSTMIYKVWDHLTKHPKHFKKLCIKLEFSVDIELDVPCMYQDPRAFLSALRKNKIISQDDVFWLNYLVEDLPACRKIVKRYDQSITTATNIATRRRFRGEGECMQPLS